MWYFIAQSWTFWLGLILGILLILWFFWGGQKYEFIGLPSFQKKDGLSFQKKMKNRYDRKAPKKSNREDSENDHEEYTEIKSIYEPESEDSDYIGSVYRKNPRYNRKEQNVKHQAFGNNLHRLYPNRKNRERGYDHDTPYNEIAYRDDKEILTDDNLTENITDDNLTENNLTIENHTENNLTIKNHPTQNNLKVKEERKNEKVEMKKDEITLINNTPKIPKGVIGSEQPLKESFNCSRGEKLCKEALESIYNLPFTRVRPNFLKNPETGRNLELDCYNDKIKIACEYNGEQHYIFPNRFHRNVDEFIAQIRRDNFKVDTCDNNGVYLITVPYNVPHHLIKNYIQHYLPENVASRIN